MIGLGFSASNASIRGAASITLSNSVFDEDAVPGTVVGVLDASGAGPGPWSFNLLDDVGGMFRLAGADLIVGATPLESGSASPPIILVQASSGEKDLSSAIPLKVRPRVRPVAQTGDLIFGAQGNMGFPVRGGANQFAVASGRENTLCETWLPAQPPGARVIYATSWGNGTGVGLAEYGLPNGETIAWSSLMNAVNGTNRRADVTFAEMGPAIVGGGFTISDAIDVAITDGNALRTVITAPLGGQRMANAGYNIIGEQQRASATLSTFSNARTTQAASAAGAAIFNGEAFTATGIVAPMVAGQRSFLLIGTSIMRGQDSSPRYIASPSRNAYGYLPVGLDSAVNRRMGWWQAAVNGQNIARQNEDATGKFAKRFAILEVLATKNGGRWPFTDIILDFRNDFVLINGTDSQDTFRQFIAKAKDLTASIRDLFPNVRVHVVDCPPIQSIGSGFQASRYGTEPALQVPAPGNHKAAAVNLFNRWISTNYASIGAETVIPAGSACCALDDGSGLARWRQTPFTAAGGGVISAVDYPSGLASGANVANPGIIVTSVMAPEVGAYLSLFDVDMSNPEAVGGNANGFSNGFITSVAPVGAGKWLVKTSSGSIARARVAGSLVRTSAVQDGTHPSHWLHHGPMADAVVRWKAAI